MSTPFKDVIDIAGERGDPTMSTQHTPEQTPACRYLECPMAQIAAERDRLRALLQLVCDQADRYMLLDYGRDFNTRTIARKQLESQIAAAREAWNCGERGRPHNES